MNAEEWPQEAIMHMNLARDGSVRDAHVGERTGLGYSEGYRDGTHGGRGTGGKGDYEGGGYGHAF